MSILADIKKELTELSMEAKKLEAITKDPSVSSVEKAKSLHDLAEARNKICILQFELEDRND